MLLFCQFARLPNQSSLLTVDQLGKKVVHQHRRRFLHATSIVRHLKRRWVILEACFLYIVHSCF